MAKTQFIADYTNGDEVATVFLLASAQQGQARNGPFWRLELRDATGSMEAKIWSPQSQAYTSLSAGDLVEIAGRITMFRERLEIAVDRMRVLEGEEADALDRGLFMPASERPGADMLAELRELCRKALTHGPWKKLILGLLDDPAVAEALRLAPAAKAMHHAYAGGLIEHTLSVAQLCMRFADQYPHLDRQTLLAGAVCHDLGKLWELSQGLATDYTGEGRLLGHIQLALDHLEPLIRKSGLEAELALHLKHLILSHHGLLEFGSPRVPATAEAFALHYADNLDAKLNQARGALSAVPDEETGWSGYVHGLDRHLFKAPATPAKVKKERPPKAEAEADNGGQLSLLGGE